MRNTQCWRWFNTSQHCSCWVGHLVAHPPHPARFATRSASIPPHLLLKVTVHSQSIKSPKKQFSKTLHHISLIKPHPGTTFLLNRLLKDQEELLASDCKHSMFEGNPTHIYRSASFIQCCPEGWVLTGEVWLSIHVFETRQGSGKRCLTRNSHFVF